MDAPMSQPLSREESGWLDWAYKGVDHTLPGNGGPECRDFLSLSQRCWESAIASLVGLVALLYAYPRLTLPVSCPSRYSKGEPVGKRVLLLLMCLTFGIELGFKFSTRQVIWIGNPCHVASMLQIFILAAPPSRIVTAAFRLHMHMLTGAPIAILFPVINTRLLPFETGVYYIQHILMLVIPFYLMKTGDPFIPEELSDFKWAFTSFGFLYIYHFLPLQFLAYHSQVNLNNMLCPAVSDPFHGKYYRLFAICHQIVLIPTLGKVFVLIARAFNLLPVNRLATMPIKEVFQCESCPGDSSCPVPCLSMSDSSSRDSGISAFSQHQALGVDNSDESLELDDDLGGAFNQVSSRTSSQTVKRSGDGDSLMFATRQLVNGIVSERGSVHSRVASGDDGRIGSSVKSRRSTMVGDESRRSTMVGDESRRSTMAGDESRRSMMVGDESRRTTTMTGDDKSYKAVTIGEGSIRNSSSDKGSRIPDSNQDKVSFNHESIMRNRSTVGSVRNGQSGGGSVRNGQSSGGGGSLRNGQSSGGGGSVRNGQSSGGGGSNRDRSGTGRMTMSEIDSRQSSKR